MTIILSNRVFTNAGDSEVTSICGLDFQVSFQSITLHTEYDSMCFDINDVKVARLVSYPT